MIMAVTVVDRMSASVLSSLGVDYGSRASCFAPVWGCGSRGLGVSVYGYTVMRVNITKTDRRCSYAGGRAA